MNKVEFHRAWRALGLVHWAARQSLSFGYLFCTADVPADTTMRGAVPCVTFRLSCSRHMVGVAYELDPTHYDQEGYCECVGNDLARRLDDKMRDVLSREHAEAAEETNDD